MAKKPVLQKKFPVVKHNIFNEILPRGTSLQELRFFIIYLSKINPMDESTRVVRFPLADFQAIMELGRLNMVHMKNTFDGLLSKITGAPLEGGGFTRFQVFKECALEKNGNGEWYVEIDAHDKALPLMFNMKGHFFKYELWNILRLKSKNQHCMYEALKEFEWVGYRVVSIPELKLLLGIEGHEYPRYGDFKNRVLYSCQKALAEYTDISFTYEPHGKKGPGGKVLQLKFTITKNKGYVDPLSLDKFIEINRDTIEGDGLAEDVSDPDDGSNDVPQRYKKRMELFMEICENAFSFDEMEVINDLLSTKMPHIIRDELKCADYLSRKYKEMLVYDRRGKNRGEKGVINKFKYFCRLMGTG